MTTWFLWLIVLGGIGTFIYVLTLPSSPSACPSCGKEFGELEHWSYGEYMWGARCPHCKYEYDITP
jgi:predicted Zn-ribbon and HTH transcriptional regulator